MLHQVRLILRGAGLPDPNPAAMSIDRPAQEGRCCTAVLHGTAKRSHSAAQLERLWETNLSTSARGTMRKGAVMLQRPHRSGCDS